jgi:hypothetical protein
MKYAFTPSGQHEDDASLDGIEHSKDGEGFGIPGQSTKGVVGTNTGGLGGSDVHMTADESLFTADVTKPPADATIQDLNGLREFGGVSMSLAAKIAYVMENGEPFCNHCEKNYLPSNLTKMACTNCGCGRPNDDHGAVDVNFTHVEGPTVADEDAGENIVKEEKKTVLSSTDDYVNFINEKVANDSDLYYKGYNDALAGNPLDEDLALLSDDYYNGYEQHKFYNKSPQQSAGQILFDIKPNSNNVQRNYGQMTSSDYDRGPLELTDGSSKITAGKLPFPKDVIEKFFEV